MEKREFLKNLAAVSAGALLIRPELYAPVPQVRKRNLRRAIFQERTAKGIMCTLCPNECVLKEGDSGGCRNRKVIDSQLMTLTYGNPCAANRDPVEKKPLYHFMPGSFAFSIATAGCNLSCLNCQNWSISQSSPGDTRNFDLMPDDVINSCVKAGCRSIAYTYSEPVTFYEYMVDTATAAKEAGIKNIIVSNGYIREKPLRNLTSVIDAANIDLKVFNDNKYMKLTGGQLKHVLDSLQVYLGEGVWLEITNLVVPGWSDDIPEIKEMCTWLARNGFASVPLHFSRFQPRYRLRQLPPTPVETLKQVREIAMEAGMKYVYIGNVPGSDATSTICPGCERDIVQRKGYIITGINITEGRCSYCGNPVSGIWN